MNKLHDYITIIKTVDNFEEAIKTFEAAIIDYGFDFYIFSQAQVSNSPSILSHTYYKTTYPVAWQEQYVKKEYFSVDPIHLKLIKSQDPFYWSEYIKTITPSTSQMLMMHDAQKYGLMDGLAASYIRQGGDSYFISIAKKKMVTHYDPTLLSGLYLLSSYLVTAYEKSEKAKTSSTTLTVKEQNIINLAAIGKTDLDIATISHISVNTVRYHWKNIFKKLETSNRVFAVITAINSGLIEPEKYEFTTNNGSSISYKTKV
jgi:LuxR family transcriptional activator of conjugal transfer of Ti plasmids